MLNSDSGASSPPMLTPSPASYWTARCPHRGAVLVSEHPEALSTHQGCSLWIPLRGSESACGCVLSHSVMSLGLFGTLWAVTRQSPLSMGILQARILEWVVMPSSEDLPDPGIKPIVSCIGRRILYH